METNGSKKFNVGFILLLLGSALAVFLIAKYWIVLNSALTIISIEDAYYVTLGYFLPIVFCVVFGYVFYLLLRHLNNGGGNLPLPRSVATWRTFVWAAPAIVFALWPPMSLFLMIIPSRIPFYYDESYFPDFAKNCGIIVGIVLCSLRSAPFDKAKSEHFPLPPAVKTLIYAAIYYLLFYLSSICVQKSVRGIYGPIDYGVGAYWMTAGNVIFFGALLAVLFRLPSFSLRSGWVYRPGRTIVWIIILAVLVALTGVVWGLSTNVYIPTFPASRGRVPDIAVVWMFVLGYLLGGNVKPKEIKDGAG